MSVVLRVAVWGLWDSAVCHQALGGDSVSLQLLRILDLRAPFILCGKVHTSAGRDSDAYGRRSHLGAQLPRLDPRPSFGSRTFS